MRQRSASVLLAIWLTALICAGAGAQADHVTGLDPDGEGHLLLRSGPGTGYPETTRMDPETNVTVIGSSAGWRQLRLDDGTLGWAAAQELVADKRVEAQSGSLQVGDSAVVSAPEGALRAGPGHEAGAIARLPGGSGAIVLGLRGDWVRIQTAAGAIDWIAPAALAMPPAPEAEADLRWTAWGNPRFGMWIDYPAALFHPEAPPGNGDGQSFVTADGRAGFVVFGHWNALDWDLREMRGMDLDDGDFATVTQDRLSEDSYVIEGRNGGQITYLRGMMPAPGDVRYVFRIAYPAAEADRFGPVVERMAASFRVVSRPAGGGRLQHRWRQGE